EKIDIVDFDEDPAAYVAGALSPSKVSSVTVIDEVGRAVRAVVPENQLSLAIGKDGQNARLAAKLTGWKIDIRPEGGGEVRAEPQARATGSRHRARGPGPGVRAAGPAGRRGVSHASPLRPGAHPSATLGRLFAQWRPRSTPVDRPPVRAEALGTEEVASSHAPPHTAPSAHASAAVRRLRASSWCDWSGSPLPTASSHASASIPRDRRPAAGHGSTPTHHVSTSPCGEAARPGPSAAGSTPGSSPGTSRPSNPPVRGTGRSTHGHPMSTHS